MTRLWTFVGILALVGLLAAPAQAVPIGNPIWITGSDVVTLVATGPAYIDELFLDTLLDHDSSPIFAIVTTGSENPFGLVEPTVEAEAGRAPAAVLALTNALAVDAPPSDTPAGAIASLQAQSSGGGAAVAVGSAAVGGSAIQADVDEPGSLLMFGFGLVALGFVMKRQAIKRGRTD